jgi:chitinase
MALTHPTPAASFLLVAAILSVAGLATAGGSSGWTGGATVFWGRNKDEGSLAEACDTGRYTIVVLSFLDVFGHGKYHLDLSGHDLSTVAAGIKHCQSRALVYLSIGGFGNQYSLPTAQSALDLADHLWYTYMAGHKEGVYRPFGADVEIDGIDFFIEHGSPDNYDVLARRLWSFNKGFRARTPVQLSATPRCRYPDRLVDKALATGVVGRINVRLYGDYYCATHWQQEWDKWTAAYPTQDTQVYVGLPASEKVVGYKHPEYVHYGVVPVVKKAASYTGFMIWDRYSDRQTNYSSYILQWA